MFTGIIEELGEIVEAAPGRLTIKGPLVAGDARPGDSIAVNGVCLTVTETDGTVFTVDVMDETYKRTTLQSADPGGVVNLERAATPTTRLGGHIVQGHVDGVGEIVRREPAAEWHSVTFRMPEQLAKYVAEKGSIAVDGVSLTVVSVSGTEFGVGLIPTTLRETTLGHKTAGDAVHLEVDVIAKHVERLLEAQR